MSLRTCNENLLRANGFARFVASCHRHALNAERAGIDCRDALRESGNESKNRTFAVVATMGEAQHAAGIARAVRECAVLAGRIARRMDPKDAAPMLRAVADRQAGLLRERETLTLLWNHYNRAGIHLLDGDTAAVADIDGSSWNECVSMPTGKGRASTLRDEPGRENFDNNRKVAHYAGQSFALNIPALVGMVRDAPDYGFDSTPEA